MRDINEFLDAKAVIIIVLLLSIIGMMILLFMQVDALSHVSLLEEEAIYQNTQLKAEIQRLSELKKNSSENGLEDVAAEVVINQDPDEAGILQNIQEVTDRSNSLLQSISFGAFAENEEVKALPLTISVETNYYSLIDFLRMIEEQPRYYEVSSISIVAQEIPGTITAEINLLTYSFT